MNRFSAILVEHFSSPRNTGRLDVPTVIGQAGVPGNGGPFMVLHLRLASEMVTDARYQTYGCGAAIASGSMLTTMIIGRPVAECLAITAEQLSDALGGVPDDKSHCPALAISALQGALSRRSTQEKAG